MQHQEEAEKQQQLEQQVNKLKNQSEIVAFIKGDAARPFCKFSKQIIHELVSHGIVFSGVNVRDMDQELYETVKKLANWPTFPQLYIDGELVGGLDVMKSELEEGTLQKQIDQLAIQKNKILRYKFNENGTESGTSTINIRLSNGTFVTKAFDVNDTIQQVFEYVAKYEMEQLGTTDLQSFVLCIAWPFEAFDSRSLSKTIQEAGLSSNVYMTLYYPPPTPIESTPEQSIPVVTEPIVVPSTMQEYWPQIMFGLSCAGMLALAIWRTRASKQSE
jgi:glutaredoxin-related protein